MTLLPRSYGPDTQVALHATALRSPLLESEQDVRDVLIRRVGRHEVRAARRQLQRKAVVVVAGFLISYGLIVAPLGPVAIALGLVGLMLVSYASIAAVMHDANHSAMFESAKANRLAGYWLDVFGASSLIWIFKHNSVHHEFANVTDTDTDLQQQPFLRLSPFQRWRPWYRFQHIYAPLLYGFITVQTFAADFVNLARLRVKNQRMGSLPPFRDLLIFAVGKVVFLAWAAVIPVMVFGPWALLVAFGAAWCVGVALAITVQVAHAVDIVEFHETKAGLQEGFVRQQAQVTADVHTRGVRGWIVRWLAGGLDRQVAHHFAPSLPHTVYPKLQEHIEELCAQAGVRYRSHASVRAALSSHFRFLRELGRKPVSPA